MHGVSNEEPAAPEVVLCASCDQPLRGRFCSNCGDKKLDKHDRSIAHLFEELVHSLTHADSKFLRSLRYLFTKPGFLTSEYLAGKRKRYSSPLSLFLIANVLYLLFGPIDTFNSRFKSVTEGQPYSEALMPQVRQKMENRHWTYTQMEERYEQKSSHEAKLMLILLIFLLSVPVSLLFLSRRWYYYDYVVFSVEYVNFILYCLMLLIPWLIMLIAKVVLIVRHGGTMNIDVNTPFAFGSVLLLIWFYLTVAARRVFRQHWVLTILKAGVLTICTVVAMYFYRFLVFEATMLLL
jgi:hypothetical protein